MASVLLYCLLASIVIRSSSLMRSSGRLLSNDNPTLKAKQTTDPRRRLGFVIELSDSATSETELSFQETFVYQKNVLLLKEFTKIDINITVIAEN
jgi:hypothetical protein